jgi:hypothetical protein
MTSERRAPTAPLIFIEQDPEDPNVFVVAGVPDQDALRVIPTPKALRWWTLRSFEPQPRSPARRTPHMVLWSRKLFRASFE